MIVQRTGHREVVVMLDVLTVADVDMVSPAERAEFAYHYGLPPASVRVTPDRPTEVLLSSPLYIPEGWAQVAA